MLPVLETILAAFGRHLPQTTAKGTIPEEQAPHDAHEESMSGVSATS